jgi:hypothetical protein
MAKQTINIGTSANDGTGSTLRAAFDICNDNFTELYDGTGGLLHKIEGTNFTGSLLVGHSTTGTLSSASFNTGVGIGALDALTTGDMNVALGYSAGSNINTGTENVALGSGAFQTATDSNRNIAIGRRALSVQNVSGNAYNVAIGHDAGRNVTTGLQNTIIGGLAGDALTTGSYNVALGYQALTLEDAHGKNTAIGFGALNSLNAGANGNNVALGYNAGASMDTGLRNTVIGTEAGDALTSGENNLLLGFGAAASAVDVSNEVTIGDSNISNVRIPSDSTLKIGVSGDLQLEHLSSNSFIKNTAVGDLYIENQVDDKDIIFRSDDGSGGLATYFYLDGGNTRVQFNKDARFVDDIAVLFGSGGDSFIKHTGSQMSMFNDVGNIVITNRADDSDIIFSSDDGSGGTAEYFRLDGGDTNVLFSKILKLSDNVELRIGGGNDIKIYHDTSNSYIKTGTEAGNLIIEQNTDDADIIFKSDDGSGGNATYFFLDGSETRVTFNKNLRLIDSALLELGTSGDLQIFHNSTDSFIDNHTGNLTFRNRQDDGDIVFTCDDGSGGLAEYFKLDGGLTLSVASKHIRFEDSVEARFGTGGDARIFHDASDTYFDNFTGDLYIRNSADDGDIIFKSDDGSGGTATYMTIDGGQEKTTFSKNTEHQDNVKGQFGDSGDLGIFHDGTNSKIENDTGQLRIIQNVDDSDMMLQCDDGSGSVTTYVLLDGSEVSTKILTQKVIMSNLPTSDPSNAGQLYTDSGVLKVSAG